jgi:hypothetical protein
LNAEEILIPDEEEVKGVSLNRKDSLDKMSDDEDHALIQHDSKKIMNNNKTSQYEKDRIRYAKMLQVHEFMLPEDIEMIDDSFWVCARPSGDRCLVSAIKGKTIVNNSQGY